MLEVVSKIPSYYLFRLTGRPRQLPMNLTLSVSYKCNSRCKTCNIHQRKADELSLDEWRRIFKSLGHGVFWVTMSGGEPFLRQDLSEIVCSAYDECGPSIINIPTNGLLTERIPKVVVDIADYCRQAQIVINVSIDDIGEKHDSIRGVPGNYDRALATFTALKKIGLPNLSIGIHTVISRFNVDRIPAVYNALSGLRPDSYITEIAEEREELCTIDSGITPSPGEYSRAVDYLLSHLKKDHFGKVGRITRAFRIEYYRMVKRILAERRQIIPCYAGFASAQISPDGDLWMCCVKAQSVGNLRNYDFDFKKVWFSEEAGLERRKIKKGECFCPLANASYTNMLHNPRSLCRASLNFLRLS
ncbi:MAG: Antilisterial bacteriocin subtilosin biosynthesis protein AlbA [Syntrophorhabdus sp. PtaU1.Bin002]|nr:MAG: Antilisterial bacteriocin subtilosin biosynthesis protein AlbA [Syntrophorhabdus sp. PtaU1.Bin002]